MSQENKGVKSNEVCKLCLHQECVCKKEKPKCESCYDKGYYTQIYNTIGSEDFGGEGFETGSQIHKIPCKECNRVKNVTCDCKECVSTPPTDSNWETNFEVSKYNMAFVGMTEKDIEDGHNWIKMFIKQTIQQERQKERQKMIGEIDKNIGMLRQWLNEDRITEPSKMVENDEIRHWLIKNKE
jgi:hypothetical protein